MSARRRALAVVLGTLAALVVVAAVVVTTAPANWLARWIATRTGGVVVLADAQGTVWSGSAVVAIGGAVRTPGAVRRALALPGRVTWALDLTRSLAPVLHLTHDAVLSRAVDVRAVGDDLEIGPGSATLPASLLQLAGAPLNTLRPEGRCRIDWNALRWTRDGALLGSGTLAVASFAVAISPVRPLGDYRIAWTGDRGGIVWTLSTDRGPLEARGTGRIGRDVAVHVAFRPAPDAPAALATRLGPLLDAIGRRPGGDATFDLGAR